MVAVLFGTVTLVKYQNFFCILQERFISISILKLSSFLLVNMATWQIVCVHLSMLPSNILRLIVNWRIEQMYVQFLSACWKLQSLGQSFLISLGFNTNAIMDEYNPF